MKHSDVTMAEKNSFVLYIEYLQNIELLSMDQRGELFTAIMHYASGKEVGDLDGMVMMAFSFIRSQMDRDNEKYESKLEKRREAGKKGGRPQKANGFSEKQKKAKKANGFSEKQKNPDNVDEDVDVDVNENEDDKGYKTICPESKEFAPEPVVKILLNDGSEYGVSEMDFEYYKQLYPGVDVLTELRKAAGWCFGDPKRRKTKRGVGKFITGWLSRAQDTSVSARKPQSGRYDDLVEWARERGGG